MGKLLENTCMLSHHPYQKVRSCVLQELRAYKRGWIWKEGTSEMMREEWREETGEIGRWEIRQRTRQNNEPCLNTGPYEKNCVWSGGRGWFASPCKYLAIISFSFLEAWLVILPEVMEVVRKCRRCALMYSSRRGRATCQGKNPINLNGCWH